jgi:hypothetical protein
MRARWMGAGCAAALGLVISCGGDGAPSAGDAGDGVVPFVPDPLEEPSAEPGPAPGDLAECTADQLSLAIVTDAEVLNSPGVSSFSTENRNLAVKALPGERCAVTAWPAVRVEPEEGAAGPLQREAGGGPDRLLMEGRQRFVGLLGWPSSCAAPGSEVRVVLEVAGGGTLSAPLPDPPPCDPARPGSAGFFMSFREAPPPSPLAASFVDLPATLPHDGVAHVVVRLHNPGDQPFPLSPCPTIAVRFYESDSETGAHANHRFNCAGAPAEIDPGGILDFAVELELPASEVLDDADGTLSIDFTDAEGSSATASADTRLE